MSDVGGLGRIPSGVERVNRSHASRDEPRRPQKDKKKKDSEAETRSETGSDTSPQPEESSEKETGTVIDVLDDRAVATESEESKEDSDDHDPEESGRHLDTRA